MKRLLALFILLTGFCFMLQTPGALAYNPIDQACEQNVTATKSTACQSRTVNDPVNGSDGILRKVTLLISTLAGIVAVIVIIIAGLMYIISNGDPQKAATARNMLIGALVGLVIIAAAQGILLFVLSRV